MISDAENKGLITPGEVSNYNWPFLKSEWNCILYAHSHCMISFEPLLQLLFSSRVGLSALYGFFFFWWVDLPFFPPFIECLD